MLDYTDFECADLSSEYFGFHDFHLREIPKLLCAGNGLVAANLARELGSLSIQLENSDTAYTYCPRSHTIEIVAGTEGEITVEMDLDHWNQWSKEVSLEPSMLRGGEAEDLIRWQEVLTALFHADKWA
mgnify:CR=1 FL=1